MQNKEPPFVKIPVAVLRHPELKLVEKLVYGMLMYHQRGNGSAFPSRKAMAESLSCTTKTISRATNVLEKMGLITKTFRHGTSSQYSVVPAEEVFSEQYIQASNGPKFNPSEWAGRTK